jgi:outer membrane protein OmpA-like peptidoglycan-associated protein
MMPSSGKTFVVFFSSDSAAVDAQGEVILGAAGDYARAHPDRPVVVAGYADPNGTPAASNEVASARVAAAVKGLVAAGVMPNRIQHRDEGAVPFALNSQESRRVEISVGKP